MQWALTDALAKAEPAAEKAPEIVKQGLSEYFLFTIDGREDIKDKEPKRLVALKAGEVPLECLYKLTDRDLPSPRPLAGEGQGVRAVGAEHFT